MPHSSSNDVAPSFPAPEVKSPFRTPAARVPAREPRPAVVVSRPEPPKEEAPRPRRSSTAPDVDAIRRIAPTPPPQGNPLLHFIANHPRLAGAAGFLVFGPLGVFFASAVAAGVRYRRGLPPSVYMHGCGALAFAALWMLAVQVPTNDDPNDTSIATWWKAGFIAFALGGGVVVKFAEYYFKA